MYAYTGARLAAGVISFEEVGGKLPNKVLEIPYQRATFSAGEILGNIEVLDPQFGNIWTNVDRSVFAKLNAEPGDRIRVQIRNGDKLVLDQELPYFRSFGGVKVNEPMLYLNSLSKVSLAINQGNFSKIYGVLSGPEWNLRLSKENKESKLSKVR